jgi:lipopolysaccharide transport system permease protein
MSVPDVRQAQQPMASTKAQAAPRAVVLEPTHGWAALKLGDLWSNRELLYFLVWRDVKIRYKQTLLGATWAILQPFLTMVIFSVFLGALAKVPSDGVPYPLFIFAGLLPWQFFANALNQSANSLVNNSNLLRKVYFPRLLVPIASTLAALVDFALAFVVLGGMLVFYQQMPTAGVLAMPALVLLALVTVLGVGLWLSALNVQYRDIRYTVPFLIQLWMFATPVVYPSSLLSEPWRTLYGLNPMVGVIEGFRWALLGTSPPSTMILLSAVVATTLLVTGLFYFRRMERNFADII